MGIFFRVALGYLVGPTWLWLTGAKRVAWSLFPFFLVVLLALRLVPAVLRRVIPFAASLQAVWAGRRRLAKRFDSYQWQKLFWFGLGLLLYAGTSPQRLAVLWDLTSVCLIAGGLGLLTWRYRESQLVAATPVGAPTELQSSRSR